MANQLYVVISGKVKIVHTSGDGRPLLMAVMGAGDVFGELELLDPSVRVSTATTLTHVTAVALDRNGLHEWIAFHPAVTTRFLSALTRRLRYTQNTVYDVVSADAPGRVAKQLLALAHQFGTQEGTSVRVAHGLTQDEFAQLVGSTRETVNRALRDFAQRGWIRLECRTVHIDNPRRLARRAKLLDAVTTGTHPRPASKSISTKATMRRGHTSSRKTDFQSRPSRSRT